jgi:hypothetical protein
MHVSSPHDGRPPTDREQCLPVLDEFAARRFSVYGASYDKVIATRQRQLKLRAIAQFLAQVDTAPVTHLLERCLQQGSTGTRRFVHALVGTALTDTHSSTASILVRSDPDLALDCRETADHVALGVQTEHGWVEELRVARVAREAIAFCVGATQFDVNQLPGRLTDDERQAIVEGLEETGLFTRATGY